jgi:hypothetical protein
VQQQHELARGARLGQQFEVGGVVHARTLASVDRLAVAAPCTPRSPR